MSAVRFTLPANWSTLTGRDMSNIWCPDAKTLGDALRWLSTEYPDVSERVLTPEGAIPRFAAVALDDVRVPPSENIEIPLTEPHHEVCVLSAFMGG